ncbi:MAG TPA: hypothetical protein V6C71_22195 [Coleofasciculaceae cyanobacterium]
MNLIISLYFGLSISLIIGVSFLHLLPRLGKLGDRISDWFCYAPGIDLALVYLMLMPITVGAIALGWLGVGTALLAQLSTLWLWIIIHELTHREQLRQANIHRTLGAITGKWQNHLAVWITALAVPIFWLVRLAEVAVYPFLTKLVKLPKYAAKDWVNVSRHKFEGLVGYDLIWCLYCDWMTGVWSLGTEMLRNVESFWCPIRFYSTKKCENCQIDFPDVANDWVAADGKVKDVTVLLNSKYSQEQNERSWFGHPGREQEPQNNAEVEIKQSEITPPS